MTSATNGKLEIPKGVIWPVLGVLLVGLATVLWGEVKGLRECDREQGKILQGTRVQLAGMEERLVALQNGQKGIMNQLERMGQKE